MRITEVSENVRGVVAVKIGVPFIRAFKKEIAIGAGVK